MHEISGLSWPKLTACEIPGNATITKHSLPIMKTSLFKYTKIFTTRKTESFQKKKSDSFIILLKT